MIKCTYKMHNEVDDLFITGEVQLNLKFHFPKSYNMDYTG